MFSIGDFARHGRVSVRMLRHYDAVGLLRPARVDESTGYRYYEARLSAIESEGVMSEVDVQIKQIPAVRVAELTATASGFEPSAIGPALGPLYAELGKRLAEADVQIVGPAVAYYDDAGDGQVLVHAALPVNDGMGDFDVMELPAVEAATVIQRGSMDGVMPTVQALARWIDDHGYRSAGYHREVTLDASADCIPAVTELQEPITREP